VFTVAHNSHAVRQVLLGIDIGLSSLKVAAFDRAGNLVGSGQTGYRTERPAPDRVEQDAEQWVDRSGDLIRRMIADGAFALEEVAGIATSGRGSGAVFVDAEGRSLQPHWLDGRSAPQHRELVERFGPECDNRALASKTLHFKQHYPELFARMVHPLFVKDFLLYRMTGVVATDPSSGPRAPDPNWPRDVWEWIGVPAERVPPVRPHTEIAGELRPDAAARLGLRPGVPVGIGGHDGACANTGAGAISSGQVCLTMGTNGVARSIADEPGPAGNFRGISSYRFLPGRWCRGGDAPYAGHTGTWLAGVVGRDHAELEAAARGVAPGADGVTFVPFLHGQIAPERRPEARAAYIGMSEMTGRAELYRATLEGVAYLYRSVAERLGEMGLGTGEWRVSGGGARNALWMQIMAALLERPLLLVEPEEGPRGVAMFTAVGLGWYPTVEACAAEWVRTTNTVEPDPALTAAYLPLYERYRRLAEAVYENR
jgi:sugar (pentulose or hexulose) kinase